MTMLDGLLTTCHTAVRRGHPLAPQVDDSLSTALQWAGLLSLLLFLIRSVFELLVVHGMYESQYHLIGLLDGFLAAWAMVEIFRIRQRSPVISLRPLGTALVVQFAVGIIRSLLAMVRPGLQPPFDQLDRPLNFGLATLFVSIHVVVFLVIGKVLIDAFSYSERERADQLETQVALTKRAEADLRTQQEEVVAAHRREQVSAARQRRMLKLKLESSLMASAVAHEIKLPLSTILLRTRLALDAGETGPDTLAAVAKDAQEVVRTIEKMNILLRSVQTEHVRVDLTEVVHTCLVESKERLDRQRIAMSEAGLDRPCFIDGDEGQLRIAIANVLRNAAEALEMAANVSPAQRIGIELRRWRRSVLLVIGDSGPGWPGNQHDGDVLSTTKPTGSGLGLYVVRTIVIRNHRGKIAFGRSSLGGAEVRLWFPRETAAGPSSRTSRIDHAPGKSSESVIPERWS